MSGKSNELLRKLPKVDQVLAQPELLQWSGSESATIAVREVIDSLRKSILDGSSDLPEISEIASLADRNLSLQFGSKLKRVVNGTGIVVHTNLGRSPLCESAIEAITNIARGYSTLEFDIESGKRGHRHSLVKELLLRLTGAEDALVTNNNASAVMLALTALAKGSEVLVSRGQLVEIGGSFRIPEVCELSGAKMVEVGTTNRTHLKDYKKAITENSGAILRVHTSNFRVIGFTKEVSLEELVELGKEKNLPVIDDLGSGLLKKVDDKSPMAKEAVVKDSVKAGVSVVTFSGDKLVGGPQAGIAVGRREVIEKMRSHPLMRAVRPDKLTFAALDATLRNYLIPENVNQDIPIWRMFNETSFSLSKYGDPIVVSIKDDLKKHGMNVAISESVAYAGGGSLPEEKLQSSAIKIDGEGLTLSQLQKNLRMGEPAVISYLKDGSLWLDLRTLVLESKEELIDLIKVAVNREVK
jgi:L-seryl-tRNA(Ser) seleniumtransferase